MSREQPSGFAAFVAARGDALHHTAYLMTGDHAAAEQLVRTALSGAWPKWRRLRSDPEPAVRRALAAGLGPRWQRGTSREPAAALAMDDEPLFGIDETHYPADDGSDDREQRAVERVRAVARMVAARRRRRQRGTVAALLVVVALAAATVARTLEPQAHPAARAIAPHRVTPTSATLPAFYDGGRVLQSVGVDLSREASTTLPFTPSVLGLDFAFRCPVRMSGGAEFEIRVNGSLILASSCSGLNPDRNFTVRSAVPVDGSSGDYGIGNLSARTFWQALGLRIGRPARAVITVRQPGFATSPPPTMQVGVYQDVPFAEYPLPVRPDTVPPPYDVGLPISHVRAVTLPGAAVNGTWTLRLPYRPDLVVQGGVSGPGEIQVKVDGVLVSGYDSYDYQQGKWFTLNVGPPWPPGRNEPRAGEDITVTVTTSHFVGRDWRLELGRSAV